MINERVRELRKSKGMTLDAFGEKVRVKKGTVEFY